MANGRLLRPLMKSTLIILCNTVVLLIILEVVARLFTSPASLDADTHREHHALIDALGVADLNNIMESDRFLFWKLKRGLKEYRVKGEILDDKLDFTVTTYDNELRSPPRAKEKDGLRILAIGDSTTFGVGVDNHQAWPAVLEQLLQGQGHKVEVINAGVPGYSSFQGKRYLERVGLGLEPDIVIVSFWFNDSLSWASQSDFEVAEKVKFTKMYEFLSKFRLYSAVANMTRPAPSPSKTQSRPRLTGQEFQQTLGEIYELCHANDIQPYFLIWPHRAQIQQGVGQLTSHQVHVDQFCKKRKAAVINLVPAFLEDNRLLFVDTIHANPEGCKLTAQIVAQQLNLDLGNTDQ